MLNAEVNAEVTAEFDYFSIQHSTFSIHHGLSSEPGLDDSKLRIEDGEIRHSADADDAKPL
jgi:hypothetical protein